MNDINVKKLSVNLSGAGSMTASGTADDLDVNISGFGDFKGADLHDKSANVNISGAGSATVWVDDKLDAEISGAGSVNYYGSAKGDQTDQWRWQRKSSRQQVSSSNPYPLG